MWLIVPLKGNRYVKKSHKLKLKLSSPKRNINSTSCPKEFIADLKFLNLSESNLSNLSLDKILADVERVIYFLILIFDFWFIDFNSILPKQNDKYCSVKCICTATFNKKQIGFYYHSEIYWCDWISNLSVLFELWQSRSRLEKHKLKDLEIKPPSNKNSNLSESNLAKQGITSTIYVQMHIADQILAIVIFRNCCNS